MKGAVGTVAFVIAAMAVGRVITEFVPLDGSADAPFVREGQVGQPVTLQYATIEVDSVQLTPVIAGRDASYAGGRWLVVHTRMTALRAPLFISAPAVIGASGAQSLPTGRGENCATSVRMPTGIPWQATFCFDVSPTGLDGAKILIARDGGYGSAGEGIRRDEVASIELGATADLWDRTEPVAVTADGMEGAKP